MHVHFYPFFRVDLGKQHCPSPSKKVCLDHDYSVPPAKTLRTRLDQQLDRAKRLEYANRNRAMKLKRLGRKVDKLSEVIAHLESSHMISHNVSDLLSGLANTPVVGELFQR